MITSLSYSSADEWQGLLLRQVKTFLGAKGPLPTSHTVKWKMAFTREATPKGLRHRQLSEDRLAES